LNNQLKFFDRNQQSICVSTPIVYFDLYKNNAELTSIHCSSLKFIPASGAATRMFDKLYQFIEDGILTNYMKSFFNGLESLSFYDELGLEHIKGMKDKVRKILNQYGDYPKALIKVHEYANEFDTPIDEHVYEAKQYLNEPNLHFTISKEHEEMFKDYIKDIDAHITYSFQKESTNTTAVDMDNNPIIKEDGSYLTRPGGHGALIENLNDIDADAIFIKNIDNVCHRDHIKDTIDSKKKLASIGVRVKNQIDQYMKDLVSDNYNMVDIDNFIEHTLHIHYKHGMTKEKAIEFLNRPFRVCGVVKNQGEPGGGPFIVDNGDYTDIQILEKVEIDMDQYKDIFEQSEYFNPVDLVCFVKDYKGDKFNLLDYVNEDRYFITEKTYKGKPIKALEHPGLWNGAMHYWNTVLVEVPLSTFNPIKTVNDLLRPGHQPKKK
jgi:hypothetical protein